MKLPKSLLWLVVSLGAVTQAHAITANLGNIDGDVDSFGSVVGKGAFTDTWTFELGGLSDMSGTIFDAFIPKLSVGLTGPNGFNFSSVIHGVFNAQSYSFNDLAPGTYTLALSGIGISRFASGYGVNYKVTSAVPEADTWLMLIVGAGLIGFQLRRKQKTLQMPGLAA